MGSPPSQALVHACSGAVAGAVALSLLFPLDTMRIRQQAAATRKRGESTAGALATLRELLQREGIAGLYRGLPSTVIALFYASFFYFFLYNALKTRLKGKSALLVPALAGIANVLASCPVYVLSRRLPASTVRDCVVFWTVRASWLAARASPASGRAPSLLYGS